MLQETSLRFPEGNTDYVALQLKTVLRALAEAPWSIRDVMGAC
jgi:hypothetical protein